MNVLVVYASQFGNTERLARAMGAALEPHGRVRVVAATDALTEVAEDLDLLVVGAPTQMFGRRHLVRSFLDGLQRRGIRPLRAAAFDTRMGTPTQKNASEAEAIAPTPRGSRLSTRRTAGELPGHGLHGSVSRR